MGFWRKLYTKYLQYRYTLTTLITIGLGYLWYGRALNKKVEHKCPRKLYDDYDHKHIRLSTVTLHYVEAGDPSAPLMVMVHGFPEFWYSYRFQIKEFADRYRVVAIDQRGYGESEKPANIEDYKLTLLTGDIKELIHALGYDKAVVVGHDWGGIVSWWTALMHPEVVDRLVIFNCPHPGAFKSVLQSNPNQLKHSWYMFMFQSPRVPELMYTLGDIQAFDRMFLGKAAGIRNKKNFTDEDMEAWKYTFSAPGAFTPPINFYRAMFQYPASVQDYIVKMPVQIIWGDEDAFIVPELAVKSTEFCTNGRATYVSGASHWVQQDDPEECNRIMRAFLEETEDQRIHTPRL